jgi:5'-3' exonuclease
VQPVCLPVCLPSFFVGNDFLPHLPLLEIREGAIERLVGIYKRLLPSLGGYISENGGQLNLSRVDVLLSDLGVVEDSIFKQRKSKEDYFKQRSVETGDSCATVDRVRVRERLAHVFFLPFFPLLCINLAMLIALPS